MKTKIGNMALKGMLVYALAIYWVLGLGSGSVKAFSAMERKEEVKVKPLRMKTLSVIGPLFTPMLFKAYLIKKDK